MLCYINVFFPISSPHLLLHPYLFSHKMATQEALLKDLASTAPPPYYTAVGSNRMRGKLPRRLDLQETAQEFLLSIEVVIELILLAMLIVSGWLPRPAWLSVTHGLAWGFFLSALLCRACAVSGRCPKGLHEALWVFAIPLSVVAFWGPFYVLETQS